MARDVEAPVRPSAAEAKPYMVVAGCAPGRIALARRLSWRDDKAVVRIVEHVSRTDEPSNLLKLKQKLMGCA